MFALNSTFNHQATMLSLTALLATLAFLGNVFSINLFSGIHLIFGSVFVFIAVTYLGGLPTFLVAAWEAGWDDGFQRHQGVQPTLDSSLYNRNKRA